ncbi:MAG: 50S ribosomal protein L7/L12 [Microgenomates bacterium OLB23]|nr:MAG: 50S ribosomal protein L7/L12 [Microgenomates bacterium OLB23]
MADEETVNETKLSAKVEKIAKEIEGLTALELSELAKHLEEVFGVSAMPAMAAMPMAGAPAAAGGEAAEEQTSFSVVLTDAGANKLAVIKAVREVKPELGLMDAKKLVEEAPKEILAGAKKEDADAAVAKITEAGGKAELK